MEIKSILTVRELASFLRVGINTAYRLVRNGVIQSVRIGRQYRIPRQAIEEYLNKQRSNCA